jgi:hypothetical protein
VLFPSLDKLAYDPGDEVKIQLSIENNSAADVSGSTLKVMVRCEQHAGGSI